MSAAAWVIAGIAVFIAGAWVPMLIWRRIRSGPAPRRNPRGSYSGEAKR